MSTTAVSPFSHNRLLLAVRGCAFSPDLLAVRGEERLSEPFSWRIEFTSDDPGVAREAMLLKPAALTLLAAPEPGWGNRPPPPEALRVVQGVITGFERLATSADQTHYVAILQPRLALLARSHQNAIYQDMSVPQIVEAILRERHGLRGQDFLFALSNDYPRREQVMQYDEDDLAFITRLLGEVGIWFRFTADIRLRIDVAEFYDGRQGHVAALTLPAVPPSGTFDGGRDAVWRLASRFAVVEKSVSGRDYNYRNAGEDMNVRADLSGGDDTTYGEDYRWGDNYLMPGDGYSHRPDPESGAFHARLRHERCLNGQTRISGVTSCASLTPGGELKVTGGEAAGDAFLQGVLVTATVSTARRDCALQTVFTGIPLSHRYGFRPRPLRHPVMAGTLPARVTSTARNDPYGHIDRDGRYRVTMLFDRAAWNAGFESLWVRQARPYAGDTYGLHLPLLAGTEVAIAFEHGNPDRPYIAGVLHDSLHGDPVTIRNYQRNVLRTPANNKLRLDDTRGAEHIKLSTEYGGKSQLNLGHLVDAEKQRRGEGFELRSDGWGALRAGKGMFISADGQPKAQGEQREMGPALGLLRGAQAQMRAISDDARAATAGPADLQAQIALLEEGLDALKRSVILLSAPDGVALASGNGLQLTAAGNLTATAGRNADISVVKNLFIGVGNALSVFVRKLGIKLIANQGPVQLQAQNDLLALLARREISIISTEDEIKIVAKKKITLNGGGSYITLDANAIESATLGDHRVRAGHYERLDRAKNSVELTSLAAAIDDGSHNVAYLCCDDNGMPLRNTPYTAFLADGTTTRGMTDGDGYSQLFTSAQAEDVVVHMMTEERNG